MGRPKKEQPNRKDGMYEVKVTVGKNFKGDPIRKSFYSAISKADAKAKAEQYKINQAVHNATGEAPEAPVTAFSTWANKWLETYNIKRIWSSFCNLWNNRFCDIHISLCKVKTRLSRLAAYTGSKYDDI